MSFNISRSANVVALHIDGPRFDREAKILAQIIGQFCGTDMPYLPGDKYITMKPFHYLFGGRHVPIIRDSATARIWNQRLSRWCRGMTFTVWNIDHVTPCTVRVHKLHMYDVYEKTLTRGSDLDVEQLFLQKFGGVWGSIFRPNMDRQRDIHETFNKLNLATAEVIPYGQGLLVMYDPTKVFGKRLIPIKVSYELFTRMGAHQYYM
jgi:hypothetical protein